MMNGMHHPVLACAMLAACGKVVDPGSDGTVGEPVTIRVVTGGTAPDDMRGRITSTPPGIDCPGTCDATFLSGTSVTLAATPPLERIVFPGFAGGGCSPTQTTCTIAPTTDVTVFGRYFDDTNIVFTSSTVQPPGEFNGVAAADQLCTDLARAAGLPDRLYAAWLSTSAASAATRLLSLGSIGIEIAGWKRPDGKLFANQASGGLFSGQLFHPARLDEFGNDVGDDAMVVTDTLPDGTPGVGTHCSDWAAPAGQPVLAGEAGGGTARWTAAATTDCGSPVHLLCFGGGTHNVFSNEPITQQTWMVFVTKGNFIPSSGLVAADALCSQEASTVMVPHPSTVALLTAGGGKPIRERFAGQVIDPFPVLRRDGLRIADSLDALLALDHFDALPNQTADQVYVDQSIWLGGPAPNQFDADCAGWTSPNGFGTTRPIATSRGAGVAQQETCSANGHPILCLNYLFAIP